MAFVNIESEKDIDKIKLGDQYVIIGPEDPEEFFKFSGQLDPLIDAHIKKLMGQESKEPTDILVNSVHITDMELMTAEQLADKYYIRDANAVANELATNRPKVNGKNVKEVEYWAHLKDIYQSKK